MLDEVVVYAITEKVPNSEEPLVIQKTIKLEIPENWASDLAKEIEKIHEEIEENSK